MAFYHISFRKIDNKVINAFSSPYSSFPAFFFFSLLVDGYNYQSSGRRSKFSSMSMTHLANFSFSLANKSINHRRNYWKIPNRIQLMLLLLLHLLNKQVCHYSNFISLSTNWQNTKSMSMIRRYCSRVSHRFVCVFFLLQSSS